MPRFSKKREARLIRGHDGRFREWIGGRELEDLPKQRNSFQGIATHIGIEFRRQHGHTAAIGEVVRTKRENGQFFDQANWYIRTPKGWRESSSETRRPMAEEIEAAIHKARRGRK